VDARRRRRAAGPAGSRQAAAWPCGGALLPRADAGSAGTARAGDRGVAAAVRLNPSLVAAQTRLGIALQAFGDLDGAICISRTPPGSTPRQPTRRTAWGSRCHRRGAATTRSRCSVALSTRRPASCPRGSISGPL
jgi:hypothetical protein